MPRDYRSKAVNPTTTKKDSIEHARKYSDTNQDISYANISECSVDILSNTVTQTIPVSSSTPVVDCETPNIVSKIDISSQTCDVFFCAFCHKSLNIIEVHRDSWDQCVYAESCKDIVRCDQCRIRQTTHGQSGHLRDHPFIRP